MPQRSPEQLLHELQVHQVELEMQNEELLRTQHTLEAALSRYEDLFEFAPVGYLTLSREGLIEETNLIATTMLGIGQEKLRNRPFSTFVDATHSDTWHVYFQRLLWDVGNHDCELKLRRANGVVFDAFLDGSGLDHEPAHVRIALSDITKNKLAEQRLIESELQYRTLADSGQALIWTSGIDGRCDYLNLPWLNFTGRTQEQELGDGWAEGVHPDDIEQCLEIYMAAFERREKFSMDYRLRHHSGEYRWIQDKGSPRYDSRGAFIGYIGHCLDITALKESEKFKHTVLNSVPAQIAVLNREGLIVAVNRAWQNFALENSAEPGQPAPHTGVGTNYLSIAKTAFGPGSEGAEQAYEGIQAVLEGRIPGFQLEYPCPSPEEQRWFVLSVMPMGTDENAVVVTHHDISERKKLEQERVDYLKRQEEASRHLVAAQEDARRRFSAELHDRTSPNLAAIDINLDVIVGDLSQEHLLALSGRLEDTRALIADTAAGIRDICAELRPPLLDYAGLPAALEGYVLQFAKRTGITVQFNCADHEARYPPEMESLLFRIFQEALTNCAKHAKATRVRVALENAGAPIVLSIADNGVGFDPARLGKAGAIGLGMLNMREMTEVAGGRFTIESAPGQGTSIAVEIL